MPQENSSKKEIKDTFGWALLQLIVVPLSLALLSVYINDNISKREAMKEYLKDITELALSSKKENGKLGEQANGKLGEQELLRSLARARTLAILRQLDDKQKREIVEFLANSDLQYQISLKKADLHNTDLSGLYLKDADLREANLEYSDLTNAKLQGVDLKGAVLDGAKIDKVQYDRCTRYDKDKLSTINNWTEIPRSPGECPYENKERKGL